MDVVGKNRRSSNNSNSNNKSTGESPFQKQKNMALPPIGATTDGNGHAQLKQKKPKTTTTSSSSGNVRVVGRIRPLAAYEIEKGCSPVVKSLPSETNKLSALPFEPDDEDCTPTVEPEVVQVENNRSDSNDNNRRWFELDAVFDGESTQQQVYIKSGAKQAVMKDLFKGYNCTILAYGTLLVRLNIFTYL